MERFQLVNNKGQEVFSNLTEECIKCIDKCPIGKSSLNVSACDKRMRKRFLSMDKEYVLYYCTDEKDYINSSRLFNDKIRVLKSMIPFIKSIREGITVELTKENKRLLHNVTSLNGHNIQELYSVVDQNLLSQEYMQQKQLIIEKISSDVDQAAKMFLRIAKNNAAMKTEFAVFKKLLDSEPTLNFKTHNIRKVLLNILHVFFQDFSDQGTYVKIEHCEDEVWIDYESIQVAFYHFFDNATKYCLPNSEIIIKFKKNEIAIIVSVEMVSLEIKEHELKKIFYEGYSGENATKSGISGDGLGMHVLERVLKLNKVSLKLLPHCYGKKRQFNSCYYCTNIFLFTFPKIGI